MTVRFGIIGTNWITDEWIKGALETGEAEIAAVYSRKQETADAFAAKHGIRHTFTDVEAFAGSDTFDAVYIASPNSLHAEHAVCCLSHRKHVLCEKPIASNAAELERMLEAARTNGAVLMEAVKSTLMPGFQAVQAHLHKIGPIRRYTAHYGQYSSRYNAYKQGTVLNAFNPAFSNGSLMDLGIYGIYPLVVLFGGPEAVQAQAVMLESGVDGAGSLLLKYGSMEAVVTHSKIANSYAPSEIQGEDGTIVIDKISQPEQVEIRYRDGRVETIAASFDRHSMYYETREFLDVIASGRSESGVNSHASSLAAIGIIDAARKQFGLIYPADRAVE